MRARQLQALAGLVALGALLRFATLDVQSLWLDEGVTARLVGMGLGDMLREIPGSESTPPLYYLLAWAWAKPFGAGEVGLRSLSALFGTATVPVAWALARRLAGGRAGLAAAALAATAPLLVWYSQEARSYALLVLLGGLSLLFFVRALEELRGQAGPGTGTLLGWAAASGLALATHYFALFAVAPEAVWLIVAARRRRRSSLAPGPAAGERSAAVRGVAAAAGAVAAIGVALLPLALAQRSNRGAEFISDTALGTRVAQLPKQYLVGFDGPAEPATASVAAILVVYGLWLLATRAEARARRGARVGATVGAAAVAAPLALSLAGIDHLITRNLIVAWLPLAAVVAAGLGARRAGRAGLAALAALCALSVAVVVSVDVDRDYQRDDRGDWPAPIR